MLEKGMAVLRMVKTLISETGPRQLPILVAVVQC